MHVTVEDGRAARDGRPDHPIAVGFLCGKVSNYLDRVYAEERLLHPLIRTGAKGEGKVPAGELGRGARPGRRAPSRPWRVDPPLWLHGLGADPGEHDERV